MATQLAIPGVWLFEPRVFGDDRGAFFESFSRRSFADATGLDPDFVQDNHSVSKRGVLRGLHYQLPPFSQGKLVRVVRGAVFDVAVDIRRGSGTFGQWVGETLSAENHRQLWIPPGFAHGFLALDEGTEFVYKTTNFYAASSERTIAWDDRALAIDWPLQGQPVLSTKDAAGLALDDAELPP